MYWSIRGESAGVLKKGGAEKLWRARGHRETVLHMLMMEEMRGKRQELGRRGLRVENPSLLFCSVRTLLGCVAEARQNYPLDVGARRGSTA